MSFTCRKCGGQKNTRSAKCKAPCTRNENTCTETNTGTEMVYVSENRFSNDACRKNITEDMEINNVNEQTKICMQKNKTEPVTDSYRNSFFYEEKVCKNGFTKKELEILDKPFDDPLFEIYTGHYIDSFEYILRQR